METLRKNMTHGINVFTDYSGSGCVEQACGMLLQHASCEIPDAAMRVVRACDCDLVCQHVLRSHVRGQTSPSHVFKDILERAPAEALSQLEEITVVYHRRLVEQLLNAKPSGSAR
eukprot:9393388-Lingulodinium_polyedra.AAC.1